MNVECECQPNEKYGNTSLNVRATHKLIYERNKQNENEMKKKIKMHTRREKKKERIECGRLVYWLSVFCTHAHIALHLNGRALLTHGCPSLCIYFNGYFRMWYFQTMRFYSVFEIAELVDQSACWLAGSLWRYLNHFSRSYPCNNKNDRRSCDR